jgi:hypothetical protein
MSQADICLRSIKAFASDIVHAGVIKSRKMKWIGHEVCMGEMKNA